MSAPEGWITSQCDRWAGDWLLSIRLEWSWNPDAQWRATAYPTGGEPVEIGIFPTGMAAKTACDAFVATGQKAAV